MICFVCYCTSFFFLILHPESIANTFGKEQWLVSKVTTDYRKPGQVPQPLYYARITPYMYLSPLSISYLCVPSRHPRQGTVPIHSVVDGAGMLRALCTYRVEGVGGCEKFQECGAD